MLLYSDISPPRPGRHTRLTRKLVQAIDGASAVASHDEKLTANLRNKVLFTLPLQQVLLCLGQQAADGFGMSQCTRNDTCILGRSSKTAISPADRLEVAHHIHRSTADATLIVIIHIDRNLAACIQQQSTPLSSIGNKTLLGADVTEKPKGKTKQKKKTSPFYFHFNFLLSILTQIYDKKN